jgi:hypothetical protein
MFHCWSDYGIIINLYATITMMIKACILNEALAVHQLDKLISWISWLVGIAG